MPAPVITSARLRYFMDFDNQQYANALQLEVTLASKFPHEELRYTFHAGANSFFHAELNGWHSVLFHDGTSADNGGSGGARRTLHMADGSEREIRGVWYGNPSAVAKDLGQHLVDVTYSFTGDKYLRSYYGFWIDRELARKICELIEPVLGSSLYKIKFVDTVDDCGTDYTFALVKESSGHPKQIMSKLTAVYAGAQP